MIKSPFATKDIKSCCADPNFSITAPHRQDGLICRECKKEVCAWHYWCGDDNLPYCPKCSPRHRKDSKPRVRETLK